MQSSGVSSDDCQTSVIMRQKEQPRNREPSTPDLLNDSANVKTTIEKNRPRSCVNPTTMAYDVCPHNSRIEMEQNRRWSGVQLGSKLMQAFDRLVFDDSDDYTDSLENNKPGAAKNSSNDVKVMNTGRGLIYRVFILVDALFVVFLVEPLLIFFKRVSIFKLYLFCRVFSVIIIFRYILFYEAQYHYQYYLKLFLILIYSVPYLERWVKFVCNCLIMLI